MFYRNKFVTNSSSTGFIAWGIVVPKADWYDPSDWDDIIHVRAASDDTIAICIEDSMHYSSSEDNEGDCILEGVYPVELNGNLASAKCVAEMFFRIKEPPNKDYNQWERAIANFCREKGIRYLHYVPKWQYVRYIE